MEKKNILYEDDELKIEDAGMRVWFFDKRFEPEERLCSIDAYNFWNVILPKLRGV